MLKKTKRKRLIFVGSIFLMSIVTVIFIIVNFKNKIVFYYSPSEIKIEKLHLKKDSPQIRIGGLVKKDSVKKIDALTIEFMITDNESDIIIIHHGIVPDLFRDGQGVIAKGNFNDGDKIFFSKELLVKHDEKYMPPEIKRNINN